jgi:hypothetical protein
VSRHDGMMMAEMRAPVRRPRQCGEDRERESQNENRAHRDAADTHRGAGMASPARRSADSLESRGQRPMSLHLEDPLVGNFEVLPPLSVEATPQSASGYGVREITPDCAASAVTLLSLSIADLSHHNNTLL